MVDAFSRLFGKGSKKTPSGSSIPPLSPSSDAAMLSPGPSTSDHGGGASDDDGFTHVNFNGRSQPPPGAAADFPGYPVLPPKDSAPPYPTATMTSQFSVTGTGHVLDGVPFALSGRCSKKGGGERDEFDTAVDDITQRIENAKSILQSSSYDFQVERSVVGNGA